MQAPAAGLRGPASPAVLPSGLPDPSLATAESPLLFTGQLVLAPCAICSEDSDSGAQEKLQVAHIGEHTSQQVLA